MSLLDKAVTMHTSPKPHIHLFCCIHFSIASRVKSSCIFKRVKICYTTTVNCPDEQRNASA